MGIVANFSIGCQSSFFLPSLVPVDGYGEWILVAGSGSVVESDKVNETAVTSVKTAYNRFLFNVSAPGCPSKTAVSEVWQSDPQSFECVGCQIVSLGLDANGNETFVNTCDPPVPMVISSTEQTVTFTVEIVMKSINVSAGADVVFLASVTLTETMEMKQGEKKKIIIIIIII